MYRHSLILKLQYFISLSSRREFIQQHYIQVKQKNPRLPFLIRECSGVEPRLYARYGILLQMDHWLCFTLFFPPVDFGREKSLPLSNYSSDQVMKALETLATDESYQQRDWLIVHRKALVSMLHYL